MTKEEAIELLKGLEKDDPETAHQKADSILLELINDSTVTGAFHNIPKWYA